VNKSELIDAIAAKADISKAAAGKALDGMSERAERSGRNPKTGETITIAAAKSPKFRAGKALKDAL